MHQKRLAAGLHPVRPPVWMKGIGVRTREGEGKETGGEMRGEEGVTREGQVGQEGRKGRQGERGHEDRGEREWKAGHLAPTVISKSQRLCLSQYAFTILSPQISSGKCLEFLTRRISATAVLVMRYKKAQLTQGLRATAAQLTQRLRATAVPD